MTGCTALRPWIVIAIASLAACTGWSMRPVHTGELRIEPTLPMVSTKISRPLYLVLDPDQVPDQYIVPHTTIKELQILEIREFVRRNLRAALASLFAQVEVVPPRTPIPAGALVAQVHIQRFAVEHDVAAAGGMTAGRVFGQMGWSFAIRPSDETDFAFSYAETVTGTLPIVDVRQTAAMMESTYRVALERLLARLADDEVLARLEAP